MWKSVKKCLHKWIKCETTSKFNFVLTWQRCWHYEYRTHSHSGSGCCWADNMDRLQFCLLVKYKLFDLTLEMTFEFFHNSHWIRWIQFIYEEHFAFHFMVTCLFHRHITINSIQWIHWIWWKIMEKLDLRNCTWKDRRWRCSKYDGFNLPFRSRCLWLYWVSIVCRYPADSI